jgi:hypothetical protein
MGVTTDLPTAWDFPSALEQVVPSEDRDFSRPREPYFAQSLPEGADVAQADAPPAKAPEVAKPPEAPKPSNLIKEFQGFLSKAQPIIGTPYHGPIDGLPSESLTAAARQVEQQLSKAVGKSAAGLLWNDATKTFNTSTGDLAEALKLLVTHAPPTPAKTAVSKESRKLILQRVKKKVVG